MREIVHDGSDTTTALVSKLNVSLRDVIVVDMSRVTVSNATKLSKH